MNDNQKSVAVRAGFVVGGLLILALLAPVIWAMVSAGVGLVVLGVIGAVGLGAIQLLPLLGQKLENKVLVWRKKEARQNPIEQLQNFFLEKQQRVKQFKQAVISIKTQIEGMKSMVVDRKRKKASYDSTEEDHAIQQMMAVYIRLEEKYHNAESALVQLQDTIEDKKFKWNFGQAGKAALNALSATSGEDLLSQILADEASSSVLDNFNNVFAELELEAGVLTNSTQLAIGNNNCGLVLDVSSINLSRAHA
jgi:hypothetical protein